MQFDCDAFCASDSFLRIANWPKSFEGVAPVLLPFSHQPRMKSTPCVNHLSNWTGKSDPTELFSKYGWRKTPATPENCGVAESTRSIIVIGRD
jgi:hypothetical protein